MLDSAVASNLAKSSTTTPRHATHTHLTSYTASHTIHTYTQFTHIQTEFFVMMASNKRPPPTTQLLNHTSEATASALSRHNRSGTTLDGAGNLTDDDDVTHSDVIERAMPPPKPRTRIQPESPTRRMPRRGAKEKCIVYNIDMFDILLSTQMSKEEYKSLTDPTGTTKNSAISVDTDGDDSSDELEVSGTPASTSTSTSASTSASASTSTSMRSKSRRRPPKRVSSSPSPKPSALRGKTSSASAPIRRKGVRFEDDASSSVSPTDSESDYAKDSDEDDVYVPSRAKRRIRNRKGRVSFQTSTSSDDDSLDDEDDSENSDVEQDLDEPRSSWRSRTRRKRASPYYGRGRQLGRCRAPFKDNFSWHDNPRYTMGLFTGGDADNDDMEMELKASPYRSPTAFGVYIPIPFEAPVHAIHNVYGPISDPQVVLSTSQVAGAVGAAAIAAASASTLRARARAETKSRARGSIRSPMIARSASVSSSSRPASAPSGFNRQSALVDTDMDSVFGGGAGSVAPVDVARSVTPSLADAAQNAHLPDLSAWMSADQLTNDSPTIHGLQAPLHNLSPALVPSTSRSRFRPPVPAFSVDGDNTSHAGTSIVSGRTNPNSIAFTLHTHLRSGYHPDDLRVVDQQAITRHMTASVPDVSVAATSVANMTVDRDSVLASDGDYGSDIDSGRNSPSLSVAAACAQPGHETQGEAASTVSKKKRINRGRGTKRKAPPTSLSLSSQSAGGDAKFQCKYCDKPFSNKGERDRHLSTHPEHSKFQCSFPGCTKAYSRKDNLQRHEKTHNNERNYPCNRPGCNYAAFNQQTLAKHLAAHDSLGLNPYPCREPGCKLKFRKARRLREHMCEAHGGPLPYPCPQPGCDSGFTTRAAFRRHTASEHEPPKYMCGADGCGLRFRQYREFQKHVREQHRAKFICPQCSKHFSEQRYLDAHAATHDPNRQIYDCQFPNCLRSFKTERGRKQHVRNVHDRVRNFVCNECGAEFSAKVSLKSHMQTHDAEHQARLTARRAEKKHASVVARLAGTTVATVATRSSRSQHNSRSRPRSRSRSVATSAAASDDSDFDSDDSH
jgi:general transcription factor IIIA